MFLHLLHGPTADGEWGDGGGEEDDGDEEERWRGVGGT